jgi:putative membrane protein
MSLVSNDKKVRNFVLTVSIAVPLLVVLMYVIPPMESLSAETKQKLYLLPRLNAILNGTAFVLLLLALGAIKKKNIDLHKKLVTVTLLLSALFLVSYSVFHITTPSTSFGGEGTIRYVYLFILLTHIVLSAVIIPFVLFTYARGLAMKVEKHKKLARITFPMWLYICLTGVIVYLMIQPYYPVF